MQRSLKHRLKEHRRALRNGDMAASALAEHALTAGHGVDLSKAEVLDSNPYTATRCMLESWHIQRNENRLNRERGNLPEVYTALLERNISFLHPLYYHEHCPNISMPPSPLHLGNVHLLFFIISLYIIQFVCLFVRDSRLNYAKNSHQSLRDYR